MSTTMRKIAWLAGFLLIIVITVAVAIQFNTTEALGIGGILVAVWAGLPTILNHVKDAPENPSLDPAPSTTPSSADIHSRSQEQREADLREQRRPYYEETGEALGRVRDRFDKVYEWVARNATHARYSEQLIMAPFNHHVPPVAPLIRELELAIEDAFKSVQKLEYQGAIPETVLTQVSWYVRRTDGLLDRCRNGSVTKPEVHRKWMDDGDELSLVQYWKTLNAMKDDLAHPT